jgi:hypothetical protein
MPGWTIKFRNLSRPLFPGETIILPWYEAALYWDGAVMAYQTAKTREQALENLYAEIEDMPNRGQPWRVFAEDVA